MSPRISVTFFFLTIAGLSSAASGETSWFKKIAATSMKSAGGASAISWSQDSRYAVAFIGDSRPWLIDVHDKKVVVPDKPVPFSSEAAAAAWSPNGQMIATRAHRHIIQLVSFPKFEGISSRTPSDWVWVVPNCGRGSGRTHGLAFTSDSQSLWIACETQNQRGKFTAAVKLSVPNLEVVDEVEASAPEIGQRTNTRDGWFAVDAKTGHITLYTVATVYDGNCNGKVIEGERPGPREYILAVDLQNKKQANYILNGECRPFVYQTGKFLKSSDGSIGYITNETRGSYKHMDGSTPSSAFYIVMIRPDNNLERFDIKLRLPYFSGNNAVRRAQLLKDSVLLIPTNGADRNDPGILIRITLRDQGRQTPAEVTRFHGVSISPDERYMISVVDTLKFGLIDRALSSIYGVTRPLIYTGIWSPGGSGPHSGVEIFSLR